MATSTNEGNGGTSARTGAAPAGQGPETDARDHARDQAGDRARDDDLDREVQGVVRAAVDAASRAGTVSLAALIDALENAGRSLSRRVVSRAVGAPDAPERRVDLGDRAGLANALAAAPRVPAIGAATTAALALRFARRFRSLGFLARRTPAFLVAAAVPALVASVSRGADELGMVASHLARRARAEGVEPDVERVRRVAVQIVERRPVDPEVEPSHGALAVQWLRRAARAALPFTSGVATADPEHLAAAASEVDVRLLGPA
jgi:hypothetical protein